MERSEAAGPAALREETRDTTLELNPARGGPGPRCSVAGMDGDGGAVGGPRGAGASGKGWAIGEEASGKGLEDGNQGDLQVRAPDPGGVAGCRARNPEEE